MMDFISAGISHLENSSEFLCGLTDTSFRFLHTNRLFQKQFGLQPEKWKGRPFLEVMQTFQMGKFLQAKNDCINNPGKTICMEIQTTNASEETWFRWEVSALTDDKKQVEGVQFLGTDITKQKKAEKALLQQAILLDSISDAIVSADHHFNIKSWNLKAEMMFNLKHEQDTRKVIHEVGRINLANDSEENFKTSLQTKGYWNGDILIEKKDGTKFYMQTMVNAINDKSNQAAGFVAVSRDVTKEHEIKYKFDFEQKKSQLDLEREQKQFKTFMEHLPTLSWINDEEGTLHYMNSLFQKTFNVGEDIVGKTIYNYYPEALRDSCINSDRQVLDKNEGIQIFEEGLDENGDTCYYKVYKFPLGSHRNRRLIGGLAVNITDQVIARMEIIKERSQFESFMENAPVLAWITDADGVLRYMNTRLKDSFNYTDDHLNKKIGAISPITDRENVLLPRNDVLIKNKSVEFFHEWVDENQKVHYFRTYKFPVKDIDGDSLEGGQSIEITSEVLAQHALQKSNELFEYAGEATRDVIWDWDLKADKIRRTGGYENVFGYAMEDLYEKHDYEKIHKDDLDYVINGVNEVIKSKELRWQLEYKYLCADGTYKTVIDQACIIRDSKGKAVRIIGSMQDVTEERDLQKQVLITEIQKKKDVVNAVIDAQEKERNEISLELHDNVNQLLAASALYLKIAQKEDPVKLDLVVHSLDYVEKAIIELRNISHNLAPADLKLNGLASALNKFSEKLNIPGAFEVAFTIGKLDEKKLAPSLQLNLYRVVQEVVNNILKHAKATKVTITLNEDDNNLTLTVMDNGKGFNQATVKKGLGTINIFNRVENFGGKAEIITEPDKGCKWEVIIPLNE